MPCQSSLPAQTIILPSSNIYHDNPFLNMQFLSLPLTN
jgi:hypothetical protein